MIVLLTDFGEGDGFVGIMKGVIAGIAPAVQVTDLAHQLPAQDVAAAAFVLWNAYKYFPAGSIFCTVVDPGVGSSRPIVAVKTARYTFVAPHNGLLDLVLAEQQPVQAVACTKPDYHLPQVSQTFHGRDIFAPVAAHLARGVPLQALGPTFELPRPTSPFVEAQTPGSYQAGILHIDHFGNLITNLRLAPGLDAAVSAEKVHIPHLSTSYSAAGPGQLLALTGSHGLLEIARRNGSASKTTGLKRGSPLEVRVF